MQIKDFSIVVLYARISKNVTSVSSTKAERFHVVESYNECQWLFIN